MDLGPQEVLVIIFVVLLLFGAKRLPELARGSGRALRIFREEVRTDGARPDGSPRDSGTDDHGAPANDGR